MKNGTEIIKKFAILCWNIPKYRHLLFLVLTVLILCTYGYYFGTFDQSSHIAFLKKNVDSSLFPNDYFFDLRTSHYSYFWLFFIPFYKMKILEITMFLVYFATTYLTFWALWKLSKTLFQNPLTTLLATITLAFPHIGFSGFPIFEFSMLNRTVVLPFELIAFRYYLKKKYAVTFLILGILYNFHALSVHFILAMIGVDMIISFVKKRSIRSFFSIPLFFITALPVLIWKFSHSGVQMSVQWEWFNLLNISTFFHLFNFFSLNNPLVIFLSVGGISTIILFFAAKNQIPKSDMHDVVTHFIYGGVLILLVQFFATAFFPLTIIIQAQIVRIGTFLTLFAYLYMSHMISTIQKTKSQFICYVIFLFLSFSPLLLLIYHFFWRSKIYIIKAATLSIVALFFITLFVFISLNVVHPGIHIWPEKTAFSDVQIWAKNNTSKDTVFLTPPSKWWLYDVEWRVISERSTVSTLSELLEGAFDPSYISYWKPRFEDVAPGALQKFKGDYIENLRITNEAYHHNSTDTFIALGKKYKASYVVVEKSYRYDLPIVYENEEYSIYSL